MNDKTAELLQKLASKLGTTTEYLWQVLVNHAPIAAVNELISLIICIVYGIILLKIHKKLCKEDAYDTYDFPFAGAAMVVASIVFVVYAIISLLDISDIVNGFFQPEYWALHKIFELIG